MAISGLGNVQNPYARHINTAQRDLQQSTERLSSGKRLNHAMDDAAGLAIAKQLMSELGSANQASRNIDYGVSQADIADSALETQGEAVSRMRELALQAVNGTLSDSDRSVIQAEFEQLRYEVDRIAESTEFNGRKILDGGSTEIQVGTGSDPDSRIALDSPDSSVDALGLSAADLSTAESARAALDSFDVATEAIATGRAELGATRNRLQGAMEENVVTIENIAAAASRISDADIAAESSQRALATAREGMAVRLSKHEGVTAGLLVDLIA